MDHIDIPKGCIVDNNFDYSLPRSCFVQDLDSCFVQDLDFTVVVGVDTLKDGFGKCSEFSSITPYATTKSMSYVDRYQSKLV